jgi:cardiolipin synthase
VSEWLRTGYSWITSELLTHLGFLLALVFLANLLRQRRSPSSTIAWLLIILFFPYVGVPLYVIFGGRKMNPMARRKERIYSLPPGSGAGDNPGEGTERLLASYGVPPARAGNRFELVCDGAVAYDQVVHLIDAARGTIHITTYILGGDEGSQAVIDHLTRRAADGVAVRLLIDDVGSWRLRRRSLSRLIAAGAEVAFFMPVLHVPFRGRANLRNHRKLMVVDGQIAMTGGMNLAWPYMGPPSARALWRDIAAIVAGPVVADLEAIFASDWKFATGGAPGPAARLSAAEPDRDLDLEAEPSAGATVVQVVASGPDVAGDPLYESLLGLIFAARHRIWIVTPYFVPDEMLARALNLAARRGVDVRVIVPARSNHLSADLARASYLRDLHNEGGRVLLYTPVMLHAKVVVFDDRLAVIGSANMDMRSLFLNYEVALFVWSRPQVQEVSQWVAGLETKAQRGLPPPGWPLEIAENVVRLLSPLL